MSAFSRWREFLFARETPYGLALLRIAFGILALIDFLSFQESWLWIAPDGAASVTTSYDDPRSMWVSPLYALFRLIDPTEALRADLVPLGTLALCLVTVGLFTRASLCVAALAVFGQASRGIPSLEGSFELMKWMAAVLLFAPAGRVLSVDSMLIARRGMKLVTSSPVLPKRVLQFLLCTVYLSTACWKLLSPEWRDGSAAYYAGHMNGFQFLVPVSVFETRLLSSLLTYVTLAFELLFPVLIWVRPFRKWLLGFGFLFHLGLALSLDIPLFQESILAFYLLFIEEKEYRRLFDWCAKRLRVRGPASAGRIAGIPKATVRRERAFSVLAAAVCALWLFFSLPYFYRQERFRGFTFDYKPFALFELTLTWPMFFRIPQWSGSLRVVATYEDGSTRMIDRNQLAEVGLGSRLSRLHYWHWAVFRTRGANTRERRERFVRQAGQVFTKLMTRDGIQPVSVDFLEWATRAPGFRERSPGDYQGPTEVTRSIGRFTYPGRVDLSSLRAP